MQPDPTPLPSAQVPTAQRAVSRLASFGHALRGIGCLIRTQANARIHLAASLAVCACGIWLRLSAADWALLALAMGGVWAAEALNTAVEKVVDLVSPQWHPLARDAKDLAAGAVLLATFAAVAVGALVLLPPLAAKFS
ncbi:MAG TPA: diacylglycerol kinase family protein [Burkholderiaceae bacterium]|nr:diacylglycerol kinase family protein [Burkholderiaceae bacterium]